MTTTIATSVRSGNLNRVDIGMTSLRTGAGGSYARATARYRAFLARQHSRCRTPRASTRAATVALDGRSLSRYFFVTWVGARLLVVECLPGVTPTSCPLAGRGPSPDVPVAGEAARESSIERRLTLAVSPSGRLRL